MRRLPYLNGVRAFEASARLGSFAGAAAELNVTPAAISRMVRLLEERLGVALFDRGANRLTLTAPGRAYQIGLTPILDALAYLTEQVKSHSGRQVLTVGVGPTFAVRWLIPRLTALSEVAPDLEVRITTGGAAAAFSNDWTYGISLGKGNWPGLVAERLFGADLIPVCAPNLALRLSMPASLKRAVLLRVAHAGEDWPLWLEAAGHRDIAATGPIFEYYDQALKAASDGRALRWVFAPTSTMTSRTAAWWHLLRSLSQRGAIGI
jgi:LysR family glycine cleavage system transcriptional activator